MVSLRRRIVLETGRLCKFGFYPGSCVYDYVGASWSGPNGGDQETYANGDYEADHYGTSTVAANFQFTLGGGTSSNTSSMMIALEAASTLASAPAAPTNLQATVH